MYQDKSVCATGVYGLDVRLSCQNEDERGGGGEGEEEEEKKEEEEQEEIEGKTRNVSQERQPSEYPRTIYKQFTPKCYPQPI